MITFSNRFGAGKYNLTVAAELRFQRIQDSIATNPQFSFIAPRYFTAYAESTFPVAFFIDGRQTDGQLDMTTARGFFQNSRMPNDFWRSGTPSGFGLPIGQIFAAHPVQPGANQGINNYVLDPNSANLSQFCKLYTDFVNNTIKSLYPNPTGVLRTALNQNLGFLFAPIAGSGCTQVFPYGQ